MADSATASSYEILAKLSQGSGPAELFAARATGVERFVVIKRLRRDAAREKATAQAFLAEARVAAKLAHPNVAQVFEVGKLGGSYFFTTEYVDGETVKALVDHARGKKIQVPIRAFLTIAAGAASGLHHAHERNGMDGKSLNIVHGEISPTNVMVSREGIVKVLDFGLQRHQAGNKLAYTSPEQVRGDKIDRRSDLFSLGVVLWELLTLGDLHARNSDEETRTAILTDETPAPSLRRFDVPPELDAIIQKLVAKDPAARFQTGGELLAAIESLATKLGFSLSTNDLARMMRLWFGAPGATAEAEEIKPVVVKSEDILAEAQAGPDPVDELLANVREAANLIRALAQKVGGAHERERPPTAPPTATDIEDARENFAQIRDRILEQARKRKETMRPPLAATAEGSGVGLTKPPAATPPTGVVTTGGEPTRKKPETLSPQHNAYSYITKVAETATAPVQTITKGDASAALRALQQAHSHVDGDPAKVEAKAEAKTEDKAAEAKTEAKADEKTEAKTEAKPDEKATEAKTEAATDEKAEAKTEAKSGEKAAEAKTDAKADDKPEAKAAEKATDAKTEAKTETKAKDSTKSETPSTKNGVAAKAARTEAKGEKDDKERAAARSAVEADEMPAHRGGWVLPAVLAAVALVVVVFLLKRGGGDDKKPTRDNVVATTQTMAQPPTTTSDQTGTTGTASGTSDQAAADKAAADKAAADKAAADQAAADQAAAEKAAADKAAADKAAADQAAADKAAADKAAAEQAAADKAAADKAAADQAAADKAAAAAAKKAAADQAAADKAAAAAAKKAAADQAAADKAAAKKAAADKAAADKAAAKTGTTDKTASKTGTADKAEPATTLSIEELYAKGDYAATNKACTSNMMFNPERLKDCALAACRTNNVALAKRWVNAISRASRPDIVSQCKSLGVEIETP